MRRLNKGLVLAGLTGLTGLACPGAAWAAGLQPGMSMADIVGAATPTVKAVMILLLLISIASWSVLVRKLIALRRLFRSTSHAEERLQLAETLDSVVEVGDITVIALLDAAHDEVRRSADLVAAGLTEGLNARLALTLERVEEAAARQVGKGVGLFATAASVTPFIGLFGTVWGIMHSFVGIAQANSTSLAVVAPGIAEALLATAIGLAVAIPATVMYNVIGKWVANYRAQLSDCSARIANLASRDAERAQLPRQGGSGLRVVTEA